MKKYLHVHFTKNQRKSLMIENCGTTNMKKDNKQFRGTLAYNNRSCDFTARYVFKPGT